MKLIITALRQEASPIIDALGLKQDVASRKIPVYVSGETLLAISGMGKLRAGIATTHLMHFAGLPKSCCLINVGMSGAVVDGIALGEALLVNKIRDQSTGREYFPDILLAHKIREASLETFDKPVSGSDKSRLRCDLVDMEASAVFQAGQLFVQSHQMMFVKVATDYLDVSKENFPRMIGFYEQSVEQWIPLLDGPICFEFPKSIITAEQDSYLSSVSERLRLTETQSHQLRDAAIGFLIRQGDELTILEPIAKRPKHKSSRNKTFELLIQSLRG